MISWLPYREISVFTPLSVKEIRWILSQVVIKRRVMWLFPPAGKFEGVVSVDGFNINRVVGNRNSFRPVLHGRFIAVEGGGGTQVIVKMTLHPAVLAINIVFFGFVLLGAMYTSLQGNHSFIVFGAFLLFYYLIIVQSFSSEADKATAFVKQVFQQPVDYSPTH